MKRIALTLLLSVGFLWGHDLHHKVEQTPATVVGFSFGEGTEFSYQPYEVYAPQSKIPYAVGRTDKHSRIVFIPDRPGTWRIKAVSDDGHGAVVEVKIDKTLRTSGYSQSIFEKFQKIFVGIALIFALFLLFQTVQKRRKND